MALVEPKAWKELGVFMHQDFLTSYPDLWSGVQEFFESLSAEDKSEMYVFLKSVNEEEHPGGIHSRFWKSSGAQIIPSKIGLKQFFVELQKIAELTK